MSNTKHEVPEELLAGLLANYLDKRDGFEEQCGRSSQPFVVAALAE